MGMTLNMVGGGGGKAVLAVTVTNGTAMSVTATKSGVSVSLTYSGGIWSAELPSFGTWIVSATDGARSQTDTVNASVAGLYTLTLRLQDIPNVYTQLEWISSNGAEINTGYQPVSSCRLYGKYQPNNVSDRFPVWMQGFSGNSIYYIGIKLSAAGRTEYYNGIYPGSGSFPFVIAGGVSTSTVYEYSTSGRTITLNGTQYTVTSGSTITTATANMTMGSYAKTWYFKLTASDANTLVRDMVPAKRNADSVVGMYDKVNGVFYGSSNSSVFTAGPAV